MALYKEGVTKCPICNALVYANEKHTGFTHFLEDSDPLWKYSDAVFHYDCFMNWEHKEEFLKRYRAAGFTWSPDSYEPKPVKKSLWKKWLCS